MKAEEVDPSFVPNNHAAAIVTIPDPSSLEAVVSNLRSANEELQRRRADAEKDRELFRDLYNKASLHASEVSKENNELLERVSIAETQVREGLTMIRQTYDVRVRTLEEEVERLRGLHAVLAVRDAKMQGDDIRRRAAEEGDLRVENQRLRAELAQLRLDYHRMERVVEQLGVQEMEEFEEEEPALHETVTTAAATQIPPETQVTSVTQIVQVSGQ